jgi:hypothetical protein
MTKRIIIAISLAIALSAIALVATRTSAKNEKVISGKLRISITSDYLKNKLSVPVLRLNDHPFTPIIRIPGNESGSELNKASAIKIMPYLTEKGDIKIDVSLLFGDVTGVTSCEQYKRLKQQPVASYYLRKGEEIEASALKKFGLLAIRFQDIEVKTDAGCTTGCSCGALCCIPNSKACIGCGDCGLCCAG